MTALAIDGLVAQASGKPTEARASFEESIKLGERLVRDNPDDDDLGYQQARSAYLLASLAKSVMDPETTRRAAGQARVLLDRLLERHPENNRWQQLRVMALNTLASGLQQMAANGAPTGQEAVDMARLAYNLARENRDRNTGDRNWADQFAVTAAILAGVLTEQHHADQAVGYIREAGESIDRLLKEEPSRLRFRYLAGSNRLMLAEPLLDLDRNVEAGRVLEEAERQFSGILRDAPNDFYAAQCKVSVHVCQAVAEHRSGNVDGARSRYQQAYNESIALIKKDAGLVDALLTVNRMRGEAKALGLPDPAVTFRVAAK